MKAKVQKLVGALGPDVCKMVKFLDTKQPSVALDNPNMQIATVTDQRNEIVGAVPFEKAFIVSAAYVTQATNPSEELPAGNAIAGAIEQAAQSQDVGKILFILPESYPKFPGEKMIRIVEHKIPQRAEPMMGCHTPSATTYLN